MVFESSGDNSTGASPAGGMMTEAPESLELHPDASAAAAARRFVRSLIGSDVAEELVDAASLVASELVTNSVLHAGTPVRLSVARLKDGAVRVEVSDRSTTPAHPRRYADDSATGRGLVLVGALTRRWGVDLSDQVEGKTVWAELGPGEPAPPVNGGRPAPAPATGDWPDSEPGTRPGQPTEGMVEVSLYGLPIDVYRRATEHGDELQREFSLILERDPSEGNEPPGRLLAIINELNGQFGAFGGAARVRLEEAVDRSLERIDLCFELPVAIGPAVVRLAELFAEADAYCRAGDLLTLATPPEAVAFRRWFLEQFSGQARGSEAESWDQWRARHEKEDTQEF